MNNGHLDMVRKESNTPQTKTIRYKTIGYSYTIQHKINNKGKLTAENGGERGIIFFHSAIFPTTNTKERGIQIDGKVLQLLK